jgi:hypothetical protein
MSVVATLVVGGREANEHARLANDLLEALEWFTFARDWATEGMTFGTMVSGDWRESSNFSLLLSISQRTNTASACCGLEVGWSCT